MTPIEPASHFDEWLKALIVKAFNLGTTGSVAACMAMTAEALAAVPREAGAQLPKPDRPGIAARRLRDLAHHAVGRPAGRGVPPEAAVYVERKARGHPQAEKLLDNLKQARLVHADVLPFDEAPDLKLMEQALEALTDVTEAVELSDPRWGEHRCFKAAERAIASLRSRIGGTTGDRADGGVEGFGGCAICPNSIPCEKGQCVKARRNAGVREGGNG